MLKPMVRSEVVKVLNKVKGRLDDELISSEEADDEQEVIMSGENNAMEQIKKYLEDNYTDPKLNLTFIAQHFGFSASYLSRKFKQDTGKKFWGRKK